MTNTPNLAVIGAGKLGKTLARLLAESHQLTIDGIVNQSIQSSLSSIEFIGQGRYPSSLDECDANLWMLSCPDAEIQNQARRLAELNLPKGTMVFHCSGALSSQVLKDVLPSDISCASIHPIHSFAKPELSVTAFNGTHCAVEGDSRAVTLLTQLFEGIGAKVFTLETESKIHYHAATVLACNGLTALLDASLETMQGAGIPRELSHQLLLPLAQKTLDNIDHCETVDSLTGPVSRGDESTVSKQISALQQSPQLRDIYVSLSRQALDIASRQGLSKEKADDLSRLLNP